MFNFYQRNVGANVSNLHQGRFKSLVCLGNGCIRLPKVGFFQRFSRTLFLKIKILPTTLCRTWAFRMAVSLDTSFSFAWDVPVARRTKSACALVRSAKSDIFSRVFVTQMKVVGPYAYVSWALVASSYAPSAILMLQFCYKNVDSSFSVSLHQLI